MLLDNIRVFSYDSYLSLATEVCRILLFFHIWPRLRYTTIQLPFFLLMGLTGLLAVSFFERYGISVYRSLVQSIW